MTRPADTARPEPVTERRRGWEGAVGASGAALIVLAAVVALGPAVWQPAGGDDIYVLENLGSGHWSPRLFAFDFDAPSADYAPWWIGASFQRRFLRVPSSGLLWIQWELFGRRAVLYHVVTAALVVTACLLLYRAALRHTSAGRALAMALLPAVHPATAEVVGVLNCQPLATAGLGCVAAALAWDRMRRTGSRAAFAASLLFCALAMTSYEAAITLPFALLLADVVLWKSLEPSPRAWRRRLGLLGVFVAYVPFAAAIRRGLTAPDTGPMRPLAEVWRSARLDATAYVFKTAGILDPRDPPAYWLHGIAGEPLAVAAALALLACVILLVRRRRSGWLGLAVFASFLAAPWLTRAAVAQLNLPTLRQLYLPVLLGGPLLVSALLSGARTRVRAAVGAVWLVGLAVQAIVSGGLSTAIRARRALDVSLRERLAEVPADRTVIGIGGDLCGDAPSLIRPGGSLFAIPEPQGDAVPVLLRVDEHTLLVRAPEAFDVLGEEERPVRASALDRGPAWLVRRPPPLVTQGWQRIPGATVAIAERGPRGIQALRYRFDEPLAQLVFLRLRGCQAPSWVEVHPGGG